MLQSRRLRALAPLCPHPLPSNAPTRPATSTAQRPTRLHASSGAAARQSQQRSSCEASTSTSSRRSSLWSIASVIAVSVWGSPCRADEQEILPVQSTSSLPKAYQVLVRNVIKNLRESINAEADGATEFEVRRKADPAKASVQEFVRQWRDNDRVSGDITHAEITGAIRELGQFYQKNGQRVSLTKPVRESVLAHLTAAEAGLPAEEDKDKFLGLF